MASRNRSSDPDPRSPSSLTAGAYGAATPARPRAGPLAGDRCRSYLPEVGRDRLRASWQAARQVLARPQLRRAELAFLWALTGEWALTVALAVLAFDDAGAA